MSEDKKPSNIRSHGNHVDEARAQGIIAKWCKLGIVELGVLYGDTSKIFCQANPSLPIYGIDPIIPDSMNDSLIGDINKIKQNTRGRINFTFLQDYSYNLVEDWEKPFDYLFIDASHHYGDVYRDLIDWYPKLAPGGVVGLHDSGKLYGGPEHWDGPSELVRDLIEARIRPFITIEFYDMIYSLTLFRKCS